MFPPIPQLYILSEFSSFVNDGNDIDIDTGCVFGGKLTALIIEKDQVVEYHQVNRERGIRKFFRK